MNKYLFLSISVFILVYLCACSDENQIRKDTTETKVEPYFKMLFNPDEPGCGECHIDRHKKEQLLSFKANEKWNDHNFDISGKLLTINDCLLCHSVDNKGVEGAIAPTPLRTIVHETHSSDSKFTGNCFTCHTIMGDSSPDLYNYSD